MLQLRIVGLSLATAAVIACGDSPDQPSASRLEGTYVATTFTAQTPDTTFNILAEGVSLTIALHPDGTTTGALIAPGAVTDLTGQWDTSAATLHIHLPNPGLLTLTPFAIRSNRLQGDPVINDFTFHLTLTRQGGR